jgi:hypothetical protein
VGWIEHWRLDRDPFAELRGPYVHLPGHDEAVARLVHAVEAGHRLAVLSASAGMGKTVVIDRALAEARDPFRRFARVNNPIDGANVYTRLAEKLGARGIAPGGPASGWHELERGVRVCALQGFQLVLAVDDCASLVASGAGADLLRLVQLGAATGAAVTVLLVLGDESHDWVRTLPFWTLSVILRSLSVSETATYLTSRLSAAGCREGIFSRRAITRLQHHARGVPAAVDHLASLCLMAGAYRGLEAISSDMVDSVLSECLQPFEHVPKEWSSV